MIRAYQERCTAIIREYEGFVAKYMGDGILVYFGYPKSLERNAERAIRTGLAIVEAMAGLNHDARARRRASRSQCGSASRPDWSWSARSSARGWPRSGRSSARRRTSPPDCRASPGATASSIGALTREIAGDAFVYEDLGAHELKGIAGLVKAWSVVGLRDDGAEEADDAEAVGGAALPPGRPRRGDRPAAPGLAEHQGRGPRPGRPDQRASPASARPRWSRPCGPRRAPRACRGSPSAARPITPTARSIR